MSRHRRNLYPLATCAIVEEGFFRHEKVRRAALAYGGDPDIAAALMRDYHAYHLAKSRKHDGFVATATALEWDTLGSERAARAAAAMVASGLWDVAENGYRFHAYFEFYPPQRATEDYRESEKDRAAAYRQKALEKKQQIERRKARDRAYSAARYRRLKTAQILGAEKKAENRSRPTPRNSHGSAKTPHKHGTKHASAEAPTRTDVREKAVRDCSPPRTRRELEKVSVDTMPRIGPRLSGANVGNSLDLLKMHGTNGHDSAYADRTNVRFSAPRNPYLPPPSEDQDQEQKSQAPQADFPYTQVAREENPRAVRAPSFALRLANGRTTTMTSRDLTDTELRTCQRHVFKRLKTWWRREAPTLADGSVSELNGKAMDFAAAWSRERGLESSNYADAADAAEKDIRAAVEREAARRQRRHG